MSAMKFALAQEVEFVDVDSMGVMWHGNYARKMENARCKFLDSLGFGYLRLQELGYFFPVVKMEIAYLSPARYPDVIEVLIGVRECRVYVGLEYEMCVDKRCIAKGYTRHILVDAKTQRALRKMPSDLEKSLKEFML